VRLIIRIFPVFLLLTSFSLPAQKPQQVKTSSVTPKLHHAIPENCNNYAGTFTRATFHGQSNDVSHDTIFFCFGDSLFLQDNHDFNLSGDPVPATPAGVGWGYYDCPPSIGGPTLQDIAADPCQLPGSLNSIWVSAPGQYGSGWFFNDGLLQAQFNSGQPLHLFHAPLTLDELDTISGTYGFESAQAGSQIGPCVNVNLNQTFSAVYLNPIHQTSVIIPYGNDCIGKFRLYGGYPEWNHVAVYTVNISLATDTSVHALILTSLLQLYHGSDVLFSVPQPGIYTVKVEDGKSCRAAMFSLDVTNCDASDNVVFKVNPQAADEVGKTICIPLRVSHFDAISASFSVQWNPSLAQFMSIQQVNPAIAPFFNPAFNVNQSASGQGKLGLIFYNSASPGQAMHLSDDDTLLHLCFKLIGTAGACTEVAVNSSLISVEVDSSDGSRKGVTTIPGRICVGALLGTHESAKVDGLGLFPNPGGAGERIEMEVWADGPEGAVLRVVDAMGRDVYLSRVSLAAGRNTVDLPVRLSRPGCYSISVQQDRGMRSGRLIIH
jgi:hypothetical protein